MLNLATRTAAALATRASILSALVDRLSGLGEERAAPALRTPPNGGWLPEALRVESVNRYDANHRPSRVRPVQFVVVHYTASPFSRTGPEGSDLDRMKRWAVRTTRRSSTHFVILRDGRLVQMVSLDARAWHVTSRWPWPGDSRGGINDRSIGVDFENVGWLRERDGVMRNAYDGTHHGPVGRDESGDPWEAYTEAQHQTALKLFARLGALYPTLRDGNPHRLIGHHDAQPPRPDPGPLCPLDEYRRAMQGTR